MSLRKFEGYINGKFYTDKNEFNKALAELDEMHDMNVSYKYISVPDDMSNICGIKESDNKKSVECDDKYVPENQYVRNITNKKDVELDSNLINKIKCATNKTDIKNVVYKKIMDFDYKIEDNLLHINELKSDYKKLDEKIKLINNQIKTLDDANNNYYLNKEYYSNIKKILDDDGVDEDLKDGCAHDFCDDNCKCNENNNNRNVDISFDDICNMSEDDFLNYLKKINIHNLSQLVDFFIKK